MERAGMRDFFMIFLRFGLLAWGGPVAQIAMIREELVERRNWITQEKFNRALAVYQALPGPEAHELCVYFGMLRHGRLGGILAGLGFMLPGLCLMLLLSWAYARYGAQVLLPLLWGITPAVAALVARALHRIAKHSIHSRFLFALALVSITLTLSGAHFLPVLLLCGLGQALWAKEKRIAAMFAVTVTASALVVWSWIYASHTDVSAASGSNGLFIEGLKAGMLSFGGAYTVIPFLQESMVNTYPAVTPKAFLDGIALSNVIPAPLVIFGTYLGFLAEGFTGALLMTAGIFLPAFLFTLVGHRLLERLIEQPALHGLLDGISAGVTGLLAVTAGKIVLYAVTGVPEAVLFFMALGGLFLLKSRMAAPAIILICGVAGYFLQRI